MKYLSTITAIAILAINSYGIRRSETGFDAEIYSSLCYEIHEDNINVLFPPFDTPGWKTGLAFSLGRDDDYNTYLTRISNGKNPRNGPDPIDEYAGIECSAFVSRCLGLPRHYKTWELVDITIPIIGDLTSAQKGDICVKAYAHSLYCDGGGMTYVASSLSGFQGIYFNRVVYLELIKYPDISNYPCRTIFPQFTDLKPANGETAQISNQPLTISVKAEGSISIENVLMWLDDVSVTPKVTGNPKSKTIKYTVKDPIPGEHRVKVQCANVVNGIDYEDAIEWVFNYGGPNDTVKITDAIASYLGPKVKPFYKTTVYYLWGNTSQVVLAGDCNGAANWFVDDIIRINIKHLASGDLFYWGQDVYARPQPPIDLSWYFDRGPEGNEVNVELANDPQHLNYVGCSALWLVGVDNAKCIDGRNMQLAAEGIQSDSTDNRDVSEVDFDVRLKSQNPGYGRATFKICLPSSSFTELTIYNVNGQLVKTLVDGHKNRGIYEYAWDGKDNGNSKVSRGVYLYQLKSNGKCKSGRLVLLE